MDGDRAAVVCFRSFDQLFQDRFLPKHDVVAQQHGKRLVPDKTLGTPDCMAKTFCLLLAQEQHVCHIRHFADGAGLLFLAVLQQPLLQIRRIVKIVLNRRLAAVGDNQDLLDTGCNGFLDNVLQHRFVHQRQHFLRNTFRVRQQPCTKPGCGDNRFSDFHVTTPRTFSVLLYS